MVDEVRVERLLRAAADDLAFLTSEASADAVLVLSRHGVLDATLARAAGRAVGFRNVLVHEYVTVDDAVVLARLSDHADLDDFVASVAAWLARRA